MSGGTRFEPMTIASQRWFAFSPKTLFAAFADPNRLKQWWGPEEFTNTFHAYDFRPGGTWQFTMHAPNERNYENTCTFGTIIEGKSIEFVHHLPIHVFIMTMTFEPVDGGTTMKWMMEFEANETNANLRQFIEAGNEQNFDRLEQHLKGGGGQP